MHEDQAAAGFRKRADPVLSNSMRDLIFKDEFWKQQSKTVRLFLRVVFFFLSFWSALYAAEETSGSWRWMTWTCRASPMLSTSNGLNWERLGAGRMTGRKWDMPTEMRITVTTGPSWKLPLLIPEAKKGRDKTNSSRNNNNNKTRASYLKGENHQKMAVEWHKDLYIFIHSS